MKPPRRILQAPTSIPYIYNNCLCGNALTKSSSIPIRQYSSSQTPLPPHPPPQGYSLLSSRRILSLCGPDATPFLQGAITTNIVPRNPNPRLSTGFYTSFLNAQGRILNDVFIYKDKREGIEEKGGWLVEVDKDEVEKLEKHVKRYRLRKKFEVRVLGDEEMGVWSLWGENGDGEGWKAHSLGSESTSESNGGSGGEIGCEDSRAPGMGRRLLLPGTKNPEVDMERRTHDEYTVRRYLKGVPEGQGEIVREHALPQESCLDFMGAIDYDKGCYVGQELTIRTHHQGVVRKRVLPVMIYGVEENEPMKLEYDSEKDVSAQNIPGGINIDPFERRGRSAGKFLGGIGNIGLGLCRLEMMTDVKIPGGTGGYKEGDEFKLKWDFEGASSETVKIKAFVPAWHLTQQGQQWVGM